MNAARFINKVAASLLMITLSVSVLAGQPEGKGGKKDDGTSSGGNGFNSPKPISLTISFRNDGVDAIKSDLFGPYVDEPRDSANPDYRMDAHIDGDSGSSYGNLFLLIKNSARTINVDIATGCVDGCDEAGQQNQPFQAREFDSLGLTVSATEAVAGGLCGMLAGDSISAPMQVIYDDPNAFGTEAPGFIDFFPATKRRSPCYGLTSEVSIQRMDDSSWKVSGNVAACVSWPGGRQYGGVAVMPFEFTATTSSDSSLVCE